MTDTIRDLDLDDVKTVSGGAAPTTATRVPNKHVVTTASLSAHLDAATRPTVDVTQLSISTRRA